MLAPSQGLFTVSCSASVKVHKKLGGSMSGSQTKVAKEMFHATEGPVYKVEELLGRALSAIW